jgi:hypothetical protein
VKDYSGGIVQAELEEHLSDPEFSVRFNMTKASPPFLPHPLTPPPRNNSERSRSGGAPNGRRILCSFEPAPPSFPLPVLCSPSIQ